VKLKFILLIAICLGAAPLARGQSALDKTTLGQSQNDSRDLANSLTGAPPPRYGKGEKKQEINSAELKSNSIKDTTFGGSLLNMGIDSAVPKLDESKLHSAPTEKEKQSSVSKQAPASKKESDVSKQPVAAEKESSFLNLSDTGTLSQALEQPEPAADTKPKAPDSTAAAATGNGQNKEQKATSAATDEKPSTNSAEKSSATKPDGDR
jgi:hypothetical protein